MILMLDMIHKSARNVRMMDFQGNGWGRRHYDAWQNPARGHERSIRRLIDGLALYADEYSELYGESVLAEDYVLGGAWLGAWKAVRDMLNGDTGRFDCGTIDRLLIDMLKAAGFDEDEI